LVYPDKATRIAFGGHGMSIREWIGLCLAVVGTALLPIGWIVNTRLVLLSAALAAVGIALFYTEYRARREAEIEKESFRGSGSGHGVPTDVHNYTGWRSGGRREGTGSTLESGEGGGD
jgi:hypothetical protein